MSDNPLNTRAPKDPWIPASLAALAVISATASSPMFAQAVPEKTTTPQTEAAEKPAADEDDVIVLTPFEVNTDKDNGYVATSSLAGSRLNTDLRDIAAPVQAITSEFMKDIGATNLQKLLVYTTNTEVAGVGGNFYGGDTWSKDAGKRMLTEPHRSTRIRGLNEADITRDFHPSDLPMDWYNISRVDISRGPNGTLFGLGSPAGLINNTLKTSSMNKSGGSFELRTDNNGSLREALDYDAVLIPNVLGIRVDALNDDAKFRQKFTYNHDKRIYLAGRWEPKINENIHTQIDVQVETARIKANRPIASTPADFISNWFGPANKLAIPSDVYWEAPGFVEDLYASQTIGGQLWDDHPVSFFSDANSGVVGMPSNATQAMTLRGGHNVQGGGWGSWVGMLNPNWLWRSSNPKNTAAYYANNPTVASIISGYESATGKAFNGFGSGMWPTQMIVSGPIAKMMEDENFVGPNKTEFNKFEVINLGLTQYYFKGRVGLNLAYAKQNYRSGYENAMEGLWGNNILTVDVNQTLRGTTTPNPNFGRPFTIGEGRGAIYEKHREDWRATLFGQVKGSDFLNRDGVLSKLVGEHTITGNASGRRYRNFDRYYALYRWEPAYMATANDWKGYATWRGIHYLGDSLLNTDSLDSITGLTGVNTLQNPALTQVVRYDDHGTWKQASFSLLNSKNNLNQLYDGAAEGYDVTKSKSVVWQGRMFYNTLVPIFSLREDDYTRWNKPSNTKKDPDYGFVLPFSSDWNYSSTTPVHAKEQRKSWSIALHGRELMQAVGHPLPDGMDVTLMYNDSSSFRPSDVSVSVYNKQEAPPSGETKDYSVLLSGWHNKVNFRVTKYETIQHNTPYYGPGPDWGWTKANIARTMDGMMWEVGAWAGNDPTKRVQPTPEWLVNRWMFGDSYDKTVANQPLPSNWRTDPNILKEPLRIRRSAVAGSANYVAKGDIDPDTGLAYVAPPLEADEVEYRSAWYRARSDSEWSRPIDQQFWNAMGFVRDYTATWGGFWEPYGWTRPNNQRSLNDLKSTGTEYELTASITKNWRLSVNASKADAVRSNVLTSWDEYIANSKDFFFDGGYKVNDTPASNYWDFKGYYDISHTPSITLDNASRMGVNYTTNVYNPYYQAKATENQAVNELRKWHWNAVTNYTFDSGFMRNVSIGGAVRWQDRSTIGYYPKYNSDANAWVIDLQKPIKGPSEVNYDVWISYERKLTNKITWSVQLNVNDLFASSDLIPTQANPDGTIAQVRLPARTSWSLRNTFSF